MNKKILLVALLFSVVLLISSCEDQAKGRQLQTCSDLSGDPQECTQSGLDCEWVNNNCVEIGSNDIITEDPTEPSSGGSDSGGSASSGSSESDEIQQVEMRPKACESAGCDDGQVLCELDDLKKVCSNDNQSCFDGRASNGVNYSLGGSVIATCKLIELDNEDEILEDPVNNGSNNGTIDESITGYTSYSDPFTISTDDENIKLTMTTRAEDSLGNNFRQNSLENFRLCYKTANGTWNWGEDWDELFVVSNRKLVHKNVVGVDKLEDLEGTMFLYNFGDDSHVLKITRIDTSRNMTNFRAIDRDVDYINNRYTEGENTVFTFMDHDFTLNLNNRFGYIEFMEINDESALVSETGAKLIFKDPTYCNFEMDFPR